MESLFDIEAIAQHRGMIVHYFGKDLRDVPQDELIALVAWLHEQNEKLRRENCDQSISHIHDLATMAKERLRW
jgi:hypothetical protein